MATLKKAATIMYPGQISIDAPQANPAEYPSRILAEGDSWFSFGSWKLESILTQLRFRRETALVTLAQPGDTIRRISDLSQNVALRNWLSAAYGAFQWDAILISGGGNDIIDDAGAIIPPKAAAQPAGLAAEEYISRAALDATLAGIRAGYERIVALRDDPGSPCPGVPLVTHAYDLATPRDAEARFLIVRMGPWLYPAMVKARIPASRWNDVSDVVLGALGSAIQGLEATLPSFHVVPTQGTLTRAQPGTSGNSNDWDNEIHPNGRGFCKLAKRVAARIDAEIA